VDSSYCRFSGFFRASIIIFAADTEGFRIQISMPTTFGWTCWCIHLFCICMYLVIHLPFVILYLVESGLHNSIWFFSIRNSCFVSISQRNVFSTVWLLRHFAYLHQQIESSFFNFISKIWFTPEKSRMRIQSSNGDGNHFVSRKFAVTIIESKKALFIFCKRRCRHNGNRHNI
jgi:hypothetical protein